MTSNLFKILAGLLATSLLANCGGGSGFEPNSNLNSQNTPSEPFFEGTRTIRVEPYKLPEAIDVRNQEESQDNPEILKTDAVLVSQASKKLVLDGFDFDVDLNRKKMIFRGQLKLDSQKLEDIELEGNFNPAQSPWISDDLFPVSAKVRSEKRMQATAVCIDTNVCDRVAVRFYYEYDGELLELHFEKDTVVVKAVDGHDEDTLQPSNGDTSGDTSNNTSNDNISKKIGPKPLPKKEEKLTPAPVQEDPLAEDDLAPVQPEDDESEDQADDSDSEENQSPNVTTQMNLDPDSAYEYNGPITTPTPKVTKDSVKGIEKVKAATFSGSQKIQAIDRHHRGRLQHATLMPASGPGFIRRDAPGRNYGADILIESIKIAAERTEKTVPGRPPISIGNLSKKTGGCNGVWKKNKKGKSYCSGHKSHQNGLDADIGFPRLKNKSVRFMDPTRDGWGDFDKARFWKFTKELSCSSKNVMAILVDKRIKTQMCAYVKQIGENPSKKGSCTYTAMRNLLTWYIGSNKAVTGHSNHIHVRLYCPGTTGCANSYISLPNGSGC